jgi:hypothetical protein
VTSWLGTLISLTFFTVYVLTGEVISIFMGEGEERWNTKP